MSFLNKYFMMAAVGLLSVSFLNAQTKKAKGKSSIYVSTVKVNPALQSVVAKKGSQLMALKRAQAILESAVRMRVAKTGVFKVLERKELKELSSENEFAVANSDNADQRIMRFKGADLAVFIEMESFEYNEEERSYERINQKQMNRDLKASASLRVVDVVSGEIIHAVETQEVKGEEKGQLIRDAEKKNAESLLNSGLNELAGKLASGLVFNVRPPKVLAKTGGRLLINRGTNVGLKKGMLVEILAAEKVTDDDTGEVFLNEYPVAKAKIVMCDYKKCYAVVLDGKDLGADKGCVVRPINNVE